MTLASLSFRWKQLKGMCTPESSWNSQYVRLILVFTLNIRKHNIKGQYSVTLMQQEFMQFVQILFLTKYIYCPKMVEICDHQVFLIIL